jgi:uncharacterized protein
MKPRVVFDTNIYLSAILFGGPPRMCLELARKGTIKLYTSKAILLELAQKLANKFMWPRKDIHDVIHGIAQFAFIVQPKQRIHVIKVDPSDNIILEAAREAKANYIVSGDKKHILPLKTFEPTRILSPATFLKKFRQH